MNNQMTENSLEQLKKELRTTRIFCLISSILTGMLLVGGILIYTQIKPVLDVVKDATPIVNELAKLDINSVNTTLEQVSGTLESVDWEGVSIAVGSVEWQEVSETISGIDVEAFNKAVEDLDTKELSKAIERLNSVIDALEDWGEKLGSIKGLFG